MSVHNPRTNYWEHVDGNIDEFVDDDRQELEFKKMLAHRCLEVVKEAPGLTERERKLAHRAMYLYMHYEPREAVAAFPLCSERYYAYVLLGCKTARRLSADDPQCQEFMSHIRRFA
jgi:hypothetical protein